MKSALFLIPMLLLFGCATQQQPARAPSPPVRRLAALPEALTGGYSISPSSDSASAGGGGGTISLSVPSWTATSDSTWLTVSPTTGTGNATLSWSAAPNAGPARTATLTIADKVFTLSQAGTAPPATNVWVKRLGGTFNDSGTAVAVDGAGNIFLSGYFKGTANFGGSDLVSAGGADIFIAKFNNVGVHQWSVRYGSTGDESAKAIALDSAGNIVLAGNFTGNGSFGGATVLSKGSYDCFVAKYSPQGLLMWFQTFGSTKIDDFNGVAVDSQDNIVVAGVFQGSVSFGGATLTSSSGGFASNVILAKYSPTGNHLWSEMFANSNNNYANSVAVDRSNNILLTGSFFVSINFASNEGIDHTITTVSPTYDNMFLAKFTPTGANVWAKRYGGSRTNKGTSIVADGNGDVIVGGTFYNNTDLGTGPISSIATDQDMFVAKYSGTDGSHIWNRPIQGNNGGWMNSVKVDAQNNVLAVGYFYGSFGFAAQTITSTSLYYDVFALKYSSAGIPTWAKSFGGASTDGSLSLAVDVSGFPVVTGFFYGTANFAGTSLTSVGGSDAFLLRLNP